MNTQILNKCIEELKKDKPDLSYIRGILETLVDSAPIANSALNYIPPTSNSLVPNNTYMAKPELTDEEREQLKAIERYEGGPVAQLQ